MSTAMVGLLVGMALGFAGYFGGFWAFLVVAGLGAVGLIVGHILRSDLHISDFVRTPDDYGRRSRQDYRNRDRVR